MAVSSARRVVERAFQADEPLPDGRTPMPTDVRTRTLVCTVLVALGAWPGTGPAIVAQRALQAPVARYRVVHVYPHDPHAFTQGLSFVDGVLYEGTGLNGRSSVRKVNLENGEVLQVQKVADEYFGEGIAVWRDRIFELTWRSGVGFVYDRTSLERVGTFTYAGEGWGLTSDGTRLIMSDGSAFLRFLDPRTQRETGRIEVRDGSLSVDHLNELEFVKGQVLANVWQTDRIARIDPARGRVVGWIDLHGLLSPADAEGVDVLNGIAYDTAKDRLFVTGKLWPKIFEVQILDGTIHDQ